MTNFDFLNVRVIAVDFGHVLFANVKEIIVFGVIGEPVNDLTIKWLDML